MFVNGQWGLMSSKKKKFDFAEMLHRPSKIEGVYAAVRLTL
jgi:hypothetical protein